MDPVGVVSERVRLRLADLLDGLQARRIGASGPLGDYLEHALDAVSGFLLPLGTVALCGGDIGIATVLALGCSVAYWTSAAERCATGELRLPPFGDIETYVLLIAILTAGAVFGADVWQRGFLGVAMIDGIAILGIAISAAVSFMAVLRIGATIGSLPGLAASLVPLVAWYAGIRMTDSGLEGSLLPALAIGVATACHVEELLRRHLLGTTPRPFNTILIATGIVLASSLLLPEARSPVVQNAAAVAAALLFGCHLIGRLVVSTRFITTELKIRILEAPKPTRTPS